jgi:xylulokinase
MNRIAEKIAVGSDGLIIMPYGNGAERTLKNTNAGASIHGWNFNVHDTAHFCRAAQEGIVCALNYGLGIMREMDMNISTVRAGHANMFLSPLFAEAFATVTDAVVELYNTDGSQGAARGAGVGAGIFADEKSAFAGLEPVQRIEPNKELKSEYTDCYAKWERILNR